MLKIDVSYKTIGGLYSDQEVILGFYNLHMLILKKSRMEAGTEKK